MNLDSPERIRELRHLIHTKKSLKLFYEEVYHKYQNVLESISGEGHIIELGSGASFSKNFIPEIITTDIIPYEGIDQVVDATNMPFRDNSVKALFMMNVFHHIPDVERFLHEANRCLIKNGRVFIFDQHHGVLSKYILKYLHHEPYDPESIDWKFESQNALSDANGALAWIVFKRDIFKYNSVFGDRLKINYYSPNSPIRYWLAGGLKSWSLLPSTLFSLATLLDTNISRFFPQLGSFVDIELEKIKDENSEN